MEEELIKKIENLDLELPQEVSDFIFSDEFESILENVSSYISDESEKIKIKNDIFFCSLGLDNFNNLFISIENANIDQQKKELVKGIVKEKILENLLYLSQEDEEKDIPSVSPAQALASIKERLGSTSSVAPITRDYSFTKTETPKESVTEALKVDPYRELPER